MANPKTKAATRPQLTVTKRTTTGMRPVRRLRLEGWVPGVVYGRDMQPLSIQVNDRELSRLLHSASGEHTLVTLKMADGQSWEKPALVQDVQHHPVDGHVLHVDFHAIVLTERIKIKIPIELKGEPVGVKQEGGILEHFLREIEIECLPTEIPAHVEFDVSELKIGDTIHVKDLAAPAGAKILTDPEGAIASVQLPKVEKPEEEAAAATEPEVIREKKDETAAEGGDEPKADKAKPDKAEAKKDTKS
jgi:large subunit ribosomal protein L25